MVGHSLELYEYLGGDKFLLNIYFEGLDIHKEENKNEIKKEIKDEIKLNNVVDINNDNYFDFLKPDKEEISNIIINKKEEKNEKDKFYIDEIINEPPKNNNIKEIDKDKEKNQVEEGEDEEGEEEDDDEDYMKFIQPEDNKDENIQKDQNIDY